MMARGFTGAAGIVAAVAPRDRRVVAAWTRYPAPGETGSASFSAAYAIRAPLEG